MIYRVRHETVYTYEDAVAVSHHIVRLTPRELAGQHCRESKIGIHPLLDVTTTTHKDYFGNTVTCFTLPESHNRLSVDATSLLEVHTVPIPDFAASMPWEAVRDSVQADHSIAGLDAYQFVFDSGRVTASHALADYARESFTPGRPILEAAYDLTHRINQDFRFDAKATEVTTPVETFFEKRRGVCQDFSHLQIACMRSLGLPARYVSGYLRTMPPKGRPRLVGADASHAWCAAWSPAAGNRTPPNGKTSSGEWVDFDPTNDCIPSDGHITLAWGRDYSDVSPVQGVLLGGAKHTLEVRVDVMPL
ncbi:MAG TPA: transglutaminase family protein [Acidisarcina sp.]